MKRNRQRDEMASLLFGLTDANVRLEIGGNIALAVWFPSGIFMISCYRQADHFAIVIGLLLKYIPLLIVVYSLSRRKAAKYLDDI